jgi:polyphosphate kinase
MATRRRTRKASPPPDSDLFLNRELSWLEFNQRVLDEARDTSNPLLERLKFLCIVSSNLDEFFEIRVAGLKQQKQMASSDVGPDGLNAEEQLKRIAARVRKLVADQYRCWRDQLVPALDENRIRFVAPPQLDESQRAWAVDYFEREVYPVLTPLAIDPGHPFPQLLNKSLNVAVELAGEDLTTQLAVVQVPRILPRIIPLPFSGDDEFMFIGHIVQHHVGALFHGVEVKGAHLFRITRNSDLYIDEEEAHNLLRTIEQELRKLNRGNAVRLEVQTDCPPTVSRKLLQTFNLGSEDLYVVDGPINLARLMPVVQQLDRPELKFKPFVAPVQERLAEQGNIFDQIRKADILLHHPFHNFSSVTDFIGTAAEDPQVLAIKQTLYRTSGDSPIVPLLIEAAENGKHVTVLIELKARFDEAANIKWARMLQEAGVDVVYGLIGVKTHCKLALVVRKESDGIRRYVHLGTGNYHPATARLYTDLGLLTCCGPLADDSAELFNLLTGVGKFPGMKKLLVAHWTLHDAIVALIDAEIQNAKAGKPAGIFAKMNSLVDEDIIRALYRASQAGVPIRLLIRGICCLRPQVPKLSENIFVRSIVGQFLEHSRIYRFENGGNPLIYLSSADWMPRNFFRRVEAAFPIEDPVIRAEIDRIIALYWRDNVKARELLPDGTYQRRGDSEPPFSVQQNLIDAAIASSQSQVVLQS